MEKCLRNRLGDATILCAGENASDLRWSRRRFTRSSRNLFLELYKWNQLNGIDR